MRWLSMGDHSSLAMRIVRRMPKPLAVDPERVTLNLAFVLIGLGGLFHHPRVLMAVFPEWVSVAWALAMAIGGVAVLIGMFRSHTTAKRLGYILTGVGCLLIAVIVFAVGGLTGLSSGLIFACLAVTKGLRLLISTAERDTVIEIGRKMDEGGS